MISNGSEQPLKMQSRTSEGATEIPQHYPMQSFQTLLISERILNLPKSWFLGFGNPRQLAGPHGCYLLTDKFHICDYEPPIEFHPPFLKLFKKLANWKLLNVKLSIM